MTQADLNFNRLPFVQDAEGCSKAGAAYALPGAGTQAAIVLETIRQSVGLTDRQIAERTGIALSVVCARRNSLVKAGFVESAGAVDGGRGVKNTRWRARA